MLLVLWFCHLKGLAMWLAYLQRSVSGVWLSANDGTLVQPAAMRINWEVLSVPVVRSQWGYAKSQCCGSGIRCLFDHGSGMGKKKEDPDPGWTIQISESLETNFFVLKCLNYLIPVRIRDPGWKKLGSGINIPGPQHCTIQPASFDILACISDSYLRLTTAHTQAKK